MHTYAACPHAHTALVPTESPGPTPSHTSFFKVSLKSVDTTTLYLCLLPWSSLVEAYIFRILKENKKLSSFWVSRLALWKKTKMYASWKSGLASERHWGTAEGQEEKSQDISPSFCLPISSKAPAPPVAVSFDSSACQMPLPDPTMQSYRSSQAASAMVLARGSWLLGSVIPPSHRVSPTLMVTVVLL